MRYFRLFDFISGPDGDLYRELEDGSLEIQNTMGGWNESVFTDLADLKAAIEKNDRLEEVECPVS